MKAMTRDKLKHKMSIYVKATIRQHTGTGPVQQECISDQADLLYIASSGVQDGREVTEATPFAANS
jgi:hypothetical protein